MRRHVLANAVFAGLLGAALAIGCDEGGEAGKIALSAVVPNPVPIELGLATGTMTFAVWSQPLDLERQEDLEMFFYTNGIGVTVSNDETGVTYNLTEGWPVLTPPDMDGEYLVSLGADGTSITIDFYNTFQGHHILPAGDYSATVDVLENDFFVTEAFGRDVVVNP